MRYIIAISTTKRFTHANFNTKEEIDTWLLELMEKEEVRKYKIKDLETGEILEDEKGKRKNA